MYSFIARQPIFDQEMRTVAYELLYRNGITNSFPDVPSDVATSQVISDQFLCTPLQSVTDNHVSFINFPYQMIIDQQADSLPPENIVIEILEDAQPDDALFGAVVRLHNKGFTIALDDFSMHKGWCRFIPYVDILKFDIKQSSVEEIAHFISQHKLDTLTLLAEKVETKEEFEKFKSIGFSLFQGYFYKKPEVLKNKRLSLNISYLIELMREVNHQRIDYEKVGRLINRDVSIAYKLMRYIKNIRYQTSFPVDLNSMSLRDIALYIGDQELRRFISIVSLSSLDEDKPLELYKSSLFRGRFCELAVEQMHIHSQGGDAFLCGLFSLLDAILDHPLPILLDQITVSSRIKAALIDNTGVLSALLTLVRHYENQQWDDVFRLAIETGLGETETIRLVTEAVSWADECY